MAEQIFDETVRAWHSLTSHFHHDRAPQEGPVNVLTDFVETIKADLAAAGHAVDQTVHDVLTKHLTLASVTERVAQRAQALQASPVIDAMEEFALGPAGEQFIARLVGETAAFLGSQTAPAEPPPAG